MRIGTYDVTELDWVRHRNHYIKSQVLESVILTLSIASLRTTLLNIEVASVANIDCFVKMMWVERKFVLLDLHRSMYQ
jgi:hypothetical protein